MAQTPPPAIFITATDATSPPSMEVQLLGLTGTGDPIDFASTPLSIQHNNTAMANYQIAELRETGTFTIFLIDIPEGVSAQFGAIADAINQFANAPYMKEQVDAVAIYQVGENGAVQLMAPTDFYNSVRNLLVDPLTPAAGATALIDSSASLLAQIESLKPDPRMSAHLVIMSDGTDSVSTRFLPEDVSAQAVAAGVPVHTVALSNANLSEGGQQAGQDYLAQVAGSARGLAIKLENQADWSIVWNRIAAFRNQTVVRYEVPDLQGGVFSVSVSLVDQPEATAVADITIPTNLPSISIDLPQESRSLSLPDLDDPVRLRFATSIDWLDGGEREIEAAQLLVNGVPQEVAPDEIDDFVVDVTNLGFGENSVQVVILDDQGMKVASPTITLLLSEGRRQIPEALAAGGGLVATLARLLVTVFILGILGVGGFFLWRQGLLERLPAIRLRRTRREPQVTYESMDEAEPRVLARLHVLESVTRMPVEIGLTQPRLRLGRSPNQADIAFENDITMSRLHATLMLEGTHYRLYDENSTSGTYVNERPVPEYGVQLVDGDDVHLGAVHLRFYQP